jgi:hypothetical protein
MKALRFTAAMNHSWRQLHIWIDALDHKQVMLEPTLVARAEYEECPPSMRLDPDDAQRLFEALWQAGLRPSKVESAEGELAATKFHLEDMRKLVFKGK